LLLIEAGAIEHGICIELLHGYGIGHASTAHRLLLLLLFAVCCSLYLFCSLLFWLLLLLLLLPPGNRELH